MQAPLAELIPFPWREPLEIPTLRGSQETRHLHLTYSLVHTYIKGLNLYMLAHLPRVRDLPD